jgi:hypothetical protein
MHLQKKFKNPVVIFSSMYLTLTNWNSDNYAEKTTDVTVTSTSDVHSVTFLIQMSV